MTINSERVWERILQHAGHEFRQKQGKPFTYEARGRTIYLHTTNRMISRSAIASALERVPLKGPGDVQDLSAPSYIYGILMDRRISQTDW